ncbi:uncharacterized protein [Rutidosis leptorrhynchoides]|uniref:uncharacterized protein n=1 Tax=Rutidosis leptorrhynchoides TaxID=125765 RepID=UPI003A99DA89
MANYDKGGLEIGSLKGFNISLIFKWIWRFNLNFNGIWVNVVAAIHGRDGCLDGQNGQKLGIWSNMVKHYVAAQNSGLIPFHPIRVKMGNGSKTKMWKDTWLGNEPLCSRFNRIFHLDVDPDCFVADRRSNNSWL